MSCGGRGQYLQNDRPVWLSPFSNKGIGGCAPIIEVSHCSASPGKFIPRCWKGGSGRLSSLSFRRNNADSVLAVEQWTSSLPSQGCWGGAWEFAHPVYMCFVDLEKAYDRVPRGILWGVIREYGVPGPLVRAIRSLYEQSASCVRILGTKSSTPRDPPGGTGECGYGEGSLGGTA